MARVTAALSSLAMAVSIVTLFATAVLTMSFVASGGLAHPRPLVTLTLFAAQCGLTIAIVAWDKALPFRALAAAGGAGLDALSWSAIARMLASPHFEGYVVLLGSLGMLQGSLTLLWFASSLLQQGSRSPTVTS